MDADTRLDDLLLRWQELRDQGIHLSPEELCATAPDLVSAARERMRVLSGMAKLLESGATLMRGYAFLGPAQQPDELGRLAHYRVLALIGEGGMGLVFRAHDPRLDRDVALKVVRPGSTERAKYVERFFREARSLAAVEHIHLAAIYDVGEDRGVPYLAMQLLRGEPLDQRLRRLGRLPVAAVLRLGFQAARGLAAAHERGLVHRDIKPSNLWLEAGTDDVKILDFGLARPVNNDQALTQPGVLIGTPAYMSPEQARGERVDARADLFSLGCVLYEAATGRSPFRRAEVMTTLRALELEEPADPRTLAPEIPLDFATLMRQLLSKSPLQRPASAADVATRLQQLEATGNGAAPVPRWRGRHHRRIAAAIALAALAVAAIIGISIYANRGTTPTKAPTIADAKSAAPFVLRTNHRGQERRFTTLAEGVAAAAAGATLEIDDDGPFVIEQQVRIERPLRIRASVGRRPVLKLRSDAVEKRESCLEAMASLVLEGLELHHRVEHRDRIDQVVQARADLALAHVRCVVDGEVGGILTHGRACQLWRSQLVASQWSCLSWTGDEPGHWAIGESILVGSPPLTLHVTDSPRPGRLEVQLRGSTLHSDYCAFVLRVWLNPSKAASREALVPVHADENLFSGEGAVLTIDAHTNGPLFDPVQAGPALKKLASWHDSSNVYSPTPFVKLVDRRDGKDHVLPDLLSIPTLADWERFWGQPNTNSRQGALRLGDDNFVATYRGDPLLLTPRRFRLAIGSAGIGSRPNGGNAGADVDQVGPGPAYDRWRWTPEYRAWCKKLGFDDTHDAH